MAALRDVSNKIKIVDERILVIFIYICTESFRGVLLARSSTQTVFVHYVRKLAEGFREALSRNTQGVSH